MPQYHKAAVNLVKLTANVLRNLTLNDISKSGHSMMTISLPVKKEMHKGLE